jgi:hypothetical protein
LDAGAGVGIAGVGDDGTELALAEVGLGDADRRGFDPIGGEGASRAARFLGVDKREIEALAIRIFDAAAYGASEKSLGRADAAFDSGKWEVHVKNGQKAEESWLQLKILQSINRA